MTRLKIRVARRLNRLLDRTGTLWAQRYESELLQTPTDARNALLSVLNRRRKHQEQQAQPGWIDPLSTARWFDGYSDRAPDDDNPWPRPLTALLAEGWLRGRGGRFSVDDVPET